LKNIVKSGTERQVQEAMRIHIINNYSDNPDGDQAMNTKLHDKYKLFMDISKDIINDTPMYDLLIEMYDKNVKPLSKNM